MVRHMLYINMFSNQKRFVYLTHDWYVPLLFLQLMNTVWTITLKLINYVVCCERSCRCWWFFYCARYILLKWCFNACFYLIWREQNRYDDRHRILNDDWEEMHMMTRIKWVEKLVKTAWFLLKIRCSTPWAKLENILSGLTDRSVHGPK